MKSVWNGRRKLWAAAALAAAIMVGGLPIFLLRQPPPWDDLSPTVEASEPTSQPTAETPPSPEDAAGLAAKRRSSATRIMDVSKLAGFAGLEPSRITVDFNNEPLESAVHQFAAQTGCVTDEMLARPLTVGVPAITRPARPVPVVSADHRVTMHLHDATLLQGVLEMVNEGADIGQLNAKTMRLLSSRDHEWGTGRLCISGPFAVVLEKVETGVPVTRGGAMLAPNEARMPMTLYADPSLILLEVRMPPVFGTLLDDKEHTPAATWVSGTASVPASVRADLSRASAELKLVWPGAAAVPGAQFVRIRGKIPVTIQRHSMTIMTESLPGKMPLTQPAGALSVVFHDFQPMKPLQSTPTLSIETYELHLEFKRGNVDPEQWKQMVDVLPTKAPNVLDAQGRALDCFAGMKSLSEDPSEAIMVRYHVGAGIKHLVPDHVQLEVIQGVQQIGVPFEYDDVPIEGVGK